MIIFVTPTGKDTADEAGGMEREGDRVEAWMSLSDKAGGQSDNLNINENRNKVIKRLIKSTKATYPPEHHQSGTEDRSTCKWAKVLCFHERESRDGHFKLINEEMQE